MTIKAYRFKYFTGALLFLQFFFMGASLTLNEKDILKVTHFSRLPTKWIKIHIVDEPQIKSNITRFTAVVTKSYGNKGIYNVSGRLLVSLKHDEIEQQPVYYGEELIINAKILPVEPPYNLGEFDFASWLSIKNIYHQTFLDAKDFKKTGRNNGNTITRLALKIRKQQVEIYRKIIKNDEAFSVASTLILGYRSDLSSETLSSYSKTGTIHALSVSGMHVGIIYYFLNWIFGFFDKHRKLKILKVLIICSLVWFYSLLTGFSPSVLRSVIMLTVFIIAKSFNKNSNGYNILSFTAFGMLLCDPLLIWDVGFQLSFLAVFGLIYLQPIIYGWFYFRKPLADQLWSSIALSISAQITTFPLSIYYFHQFPLYFIISNLFILIPLTILMYLGLLILIFKLYFLAEVFEWIILFMNNGLKCIAELPFSSIDQIWINEFQLVLLTIILLLILIAFTDKRRYLVIIALFLSLVLQISLSFNKIKSINQRLIIWFTLQRGYAVAFIISDRAFVVTDLSTSDKNYYFYIQPTLDKLGIKEKKILAWESELSHLGFRKSMHEIEFMGYRILPIGPKSKSLSLAPRFWFDAIWLHQNPNISLPLLQNSFSFKSIVIDPTNNKRNQQKWAEDAKKIIVPVHILKKNKAYLIDLSK
ncbi:MAG: ComEC family competence protein [Pedobacter sp.]|nr:MAG: ComEC family competence protein [Pedobacter sp.]